VLARRSCDPATLEFVLHNRLITIVAAHSLAERSALLDEMQVLADQLGDPLAQSAVYSGRSFEAFERGDTEAALDALAKFEEIGTRLGRPVLVWQSRWANSTAALLAGDVDRAEMLAEDCLRLGTESGQPDAIQFYAALLIAVRWHQGRVGELEPLVAQVTADTPGVPAFAAQLAHCRTESGDDDGARELLRVAAADDFASIPDDSVWTSTLVLYAEVAAHLGDHAVAATLVELMRPFMDVTAYNGTTNLGLVADAVGLLETTLGRYADAETSFERAMEIHKRFKAPFFLARTLLHRA
jgi:hypothetical protein